MEINLDLVRVTEDAAIAASNFIGSGNKELADKAATDAMMARISKSSFKAKVVISEYIKDNSYGLPLNEIVGNQDSKYTYDLCVDPIEGTRPTANGGPEALSVIGIAHQNSLLNIEEYYAMKLAYGAEIASRVHIPLDIPLKDIVLTTVV